MMMRSPENKNRTKPKEKDERDGISHLEKKVKMMTREAIIWIREAYVCYVCTVAHLIQIYRIDTDL
jgi:hypothetical protein